MELSIDKSVVLYIHGKGGNAGESDHYKNLFPNCDVEGLDYQSNEPWENRLEIISKINELETNYNKIILVANSIGAYYSMNAQISSKIDRAYFISPIVDMEKLIKDMMLWANVSETELQEKQVIETDFGENLSWEYLCYVRNHPVQWNASTFILYGTSDNLTAKETVEIFATKWKAKVTTMEDGEHWFHTVGQMEFLDNWVVENEHQL